MTKSSIIFSCITVIIFLGCASSQSKYPYSGYSCSESLLHFYSRCYDKKLSKEEFEEKVKNCEKELATGICVKEQADFLWCMGRVEPGSYSRGGAFGGSGGAGFAGPTLDGCDCSSALGDIKKCRMKQGMFDQK